MHRILHALIFTAALIAGSPAAQALTAAEVFAKANHGIYLVIVTSDEPGVLDVVAQGSAVLIAPGRFVTNCHVLARGKHFVVSRREDKIMERVLVVHFDQGKDLCELDLAQPKSGFDDPVELAPPDALQIGQSVFAIGSPRGMELTISNGIVSGFRDAHGGIKMIQTTAAVSRGSSGGGLFDDTGRLIGITTLMAKDAQNMNFAIAAKYIPSAGISAADLLKQRTAVTANSPTTQEIAFERQERLRREERDQIVARQKEIPEPSSRAQDQSLQPGTVPPLAPAASRKPLATRLAPYQSTGDPLLPAKTYEQMAKKGQLAGLDDDGVIRKVYETLIRQHVADELKWGEGGNYVAQFQLQLRGGEVMFVIPAKPSGIDRFDQEAQRAIGAASPFPVPQDNEVFTQLSEMTIVVRAPDHSLTRVPATTVAPKKNAK
jgi:hypothetical protein